MTLFELLNTVDKEAGLNSFNGLERRTEEFHKAYKKFVQTLNFVFHNTTKTDFKKNLIISLEKKDLYIPSSASEYDAMLYELKIDLCNCTFLYCYILEMYENNLQSECDENKKDILLAFRSINRVLPNPYKCIQNQQEKNAYQQTRNSKFPC